MRRSTHIFTTTNNTGNTKWLVVFLIWYNIWWFKASVKAESSQHEDPALNSLSVYAGITKNSSIIDNQDSPHNNNNNNNNQNLKEIYDRFLEKQHKEDENLKRVKKRVYDLLEDTEHYMNNQNRSFYNELQEVTQNKKEKTNDDSKEFDLYNNTIPSISNVYNLKSEICGNLKNNTNNINKAQETKDKEEFQTHLVPSSIQTYIKALHSFCKRNDIYNELYFVNIPKELDLITYKLYNTKIQCQIQPNLCKSWLNKYFEFFEKNSEVFTKLTECTTIHNFMNSIELMKFYISLIILVDSKIIKNELWKIKLKLKRKVPLTHKIIDPHKILIEHWNSSKPFGKLKIRGGNVHVKIICSILKNVLFISDDLNDESEGNKEESVIGSHCATFLLSLGSEISLIYNVTQNKDISLDKNSFQRIINSFMHLKTEMEKFLNFVIQRKHELIENIQKLSKNEITLMQLLYNQIIHLVVHRVLVPSINIKEDKEIFEITKSVVTRLETFLSAIALMSLSDGHNLNVTLSTTEGLELRKLIMMYFKFNFIHITLTKLNTQIQELKCEITENIKKNNELHRLYRVIENGKESLYEVYDLLNTFSKLISNYQARKVVFQYNNIEKIHNVIKNIRAMRLPFYFPDLTNEDQSKIFNAYHKIKLLYSQMYEISSVAFESE